MLIQYKTLQANFLIDDSKKLLTKIPIISMIQYMDLMSLTLLTITI